MAKRAKSKSRSFYIEALKSRGAKGRLSKMKKAELEKLYTKTMPGTEHGEDHDGPKTDHDGQQGDGLSLAPDPRAQEGADAAGTAAEGLGRAGRAAGEAAARVGVERGATLLKQAAPIVVGDEAFKLLNDGANDQFVIAGSGQRAPLPGYHRMSTGEHMRNDEKEKD